MYPSVSHIRPNPIARNCPRPANVVRMCGPTAATRAENMSATKTTTDHDNRLARETSPYFLQHKNTPVAACPPTPPRSKTYQQTNPTLGRLCGLPLVPRHGT